MGFAVPAAIGAKVGRPDRMVWAIDGDGCFQMTAQELVTAIVRAHPGQGRASSTTRYLGMVRQWQEMFYEERYSEVYLSPDLPDYVKWAEAMGCVGIRVDTPEEVAAGDREGQRDRRPPGRHRLPHRLPREGVPDGARRRERTTTSSSTPQLGAGRSLTMATEIATTTSFGPRREQGRRARPRRRACSPGAASTSSRSPSRPTDDERFSRITIVVDAESAPLEQIVKQLNKLIHGDQDHRARTRRRRRARAAARDRAGRRAETRGQVIELVAIFEGKILDVGHDALTIMARRASPTSSTTSRSCCAVSASSSCSAPAGSRCPSSTASPSSCGGQDRATPTVDHGKAGVTDGRNVYYDDDADPSLIAGRKVAILGYGSQGHAHALNLKDSGVDVRRRPARGLVVEGQGRGGRAAGAADRPRPSAEADVIMSCCPTPSRRRSTRPTSRRTSSTGNALAFAHGFNIRFEQIAPPDGRRRGA